MTHEINTFDELAKKILIKGLRYKIFYMDSKECDQCVTGWVGYISGTLVGVVGEDGKHYRIKRDNIIEFVYLGRFNVIKGVKQENKIIIGDE